MHDLTAICCLLESGMKYVFLLAPVHNYHASSPIRLEVTACNTAPHKLRRQYQRRVLGADIWFSSYADTFNVTLMC